MSGAILGETTFAVIGLLFLLTAIRTFTSTLYMSLYGNVPNETVGAIALVVFAMSILAVVLAWRASPRRTIALAALVLVAASIASAVVRWSWGDIVLAAIAVVAGTWWLALTQAARSAEVGSPFVLALPLALVVDLALRATFRTIPVVDLPDLSALGFSVLAGLVMLAAGLAAYGTERSWTSPGIRGSLALLAIPPLLLVGETGATDPGQAAGIGLLARGPEGAGAWYAVAALLGLGMTLGAVAAARARPPRRIAAAIAIVIGAAVMWSHLPIAATAGAAILAAGVVLAGATLPDTLSRPAGSPAVAVIALSVGWVVFVALAFLFYAYYALPQAALVATAIVLVGVLAALPVPAPRFGGTGVALIAALGVIVPLVALATTPAATTDTGARASFRLMTYNVHQGFDEGNVPALDRIADTIRAETPDVVILQEVSRGWMINDQHDVLTVLSERLAMPYVFGPTIGDAYGNAVLSRLPLTEIERFSYPRQPLLRHQPRGFIRFRVADVLVLATHLDHIEGATEVRQGQVHALLAEWSFQRPAIVAGDLNALPGTPELQLLEGAGFRDLAKDDAADQPTIPASDPKQRIDYVWGIGVSASQVHTVASTASDHRPLVVTISKQR